MSTEASAFPKTRMAPGEPGLVSHSEDARLDSLSRFRLTVYLVWLTKVSVQLG